MRPENHGLLNIWINAIFEHASSLPADDAEVFVQRELSKLEKDFSVILVREGRDVVVVIPA